MVDSLLRGLTKEDLEKWLFAARPKSRPTPIFRRPRAEALCIRHCRIDWDVAKRFLEVLYHEGMVRRTRLAMRAGTNYTACNKYVAWMEEINWVSMQAGEIRLTEAGVQICTRLFVAQ